MATFPLFEGALWLKSPFGKQLSENDALTLD